MRPCATDFSIAAIMSRHGRARTTSRCRERDPPDSISPLGTCPSIVERRYRGMPARILPLRAGEIEICRSDPPFRLQFRFFDRTFLRNVFLSY